MNQYKAIFFDLDGTLLPMDMREFTQGYFQFLYKKLAVFGYDEKKMVEVIWNCVGAMMKNTGEITNYELFWKLFFTELDGPVEEVKALANEFYSKEFDEAKCFTKPNELAKKAVEIAHQKAPIVALATNPLFPMPGQITRMNWVGLGPENFDIVTSYEDSRFCKPNPEYFKSLCEKLQVEPSECLMIGNDEEEDMVCCTQAGLHGYLVTDTMIPSKNHPWSGPRGSFTDMIKMLEGLNEYGTVNSK